MCLYGWVLLIYARLYFMISKIQKYSGPACTFRAVKRPIGCTSEGPDKAARRLSESYKRWQPKLLCSGSAWLWPSVAKLDNKSISRKLTSFFFLPSGWTRFKARQHWRFVRVPAAQPQLLLNLCPGHSNEEK